jgi:hypothetical protein
MTKDYSDRIGNWMQVYSGGCFYPLDPRPEDVHIGDIAHSLAHQCRYAGHSMRFYSIAEHCCHIHDAIEDEHKFAALMHDAAEAYLVDVPRPVKPYLTEYRGIEENIERVIFKKFGLPFPFHVRVKQLDNSIIVDEKAALMYECDQDWYLIGFEPLGVEIECWTPERAKAAFLNRFLRHYNVLERTRIAEPHGA